MEDVLQSSYYKSPLGYNNEDWFVDEVIKLENQMNFYFKNTNKDIIMTQEDYRKKNFCRLCERNNEPDKVKDHCQLTGKNRGPALSKCNIYVTQDQSNLTPFIFHNFSNYDCHLSFKKLVDKKNDKVKFKIIPKTKEEYIRYGCIRFIDSYRFSSSSLDSLVETLADNSHKTLKEEEIVDELLKIVNEIKILIKEDRYIKDLRKDYPDKIEKLEEALLNYIGENDFKILKTEIPDNKWKYLTRKLA